MQRKPQPAFDRFNEKPAFRGDRFSEGGDRFGGERRPRFSNDRFEDRGSRFGGDRFDRGDRFGGDRGGRFADRGERFGGDRFERREGAFGGNRRFNDGKPFRRFARREPRFGDRSGPRAPAFETRRYTDRAAFVQTQTVRLDADVAAYFADAEAVNAALRQIIAISRLVKDEAAKAEAVRDQKAQAQAAVAEEAAEGEEVALETEAADAEEAAAAPEAEAAAGETTEEKKETL